MDIDSLTDDQLDALASQLAGRLPTGRHGDRIVTTRRQLLAAAAGGSAGVAALVKLGIDPATAQSAAGQVGTQSSPETVYAFDLDVQNGATFNGTDLTGVGSFSTGKATIGGYQNRELIASYSDSSDFAVEDVSDYRVVFIEVDDLRLVDGGGIALRINTDSTDNYHFTQRADGSFSTGSGTEMPLLDPDGSLVNSTANGSWRLGSYTRPVISGSGNISRIPGLATVGGYLDDSDTDLTDVELITIGDSAGSIALRSDGITISGRR